MLIVMCFLPIAVNGQDTRIGDERYDPRNERIDIVSLSNKVQQMETMVSNLKQNQICALHGTELYTQCGIYHRLCIAICYL